MSVSDTVFNIFLEHVSVRLAAVFFVPIRAPDFTVEFAVFQNGLAVFAAYFVRNLPYSVALCNRVYEFLVVLEGYELTTKWLCRFSVFKCVVTST